MIKYNTKNLISALKTMTLVTPRKTQYPIIATVKIDVCGDMCTITGTDLTQTATVRVECEGNSTWLTCVDPRTLIDVIDAKGSAVTLTLSEDTLIVAQGHKITQLTTLPAEDFPEPAFGAAAATYRFDCPAFLAALNRVAHAIGKEETRHYLRGIHFDTHESTLKLVATDGHRLAAHDTGISRQIVKDGGTILPAAAVKMLRTALKKRTGTLTVEVAETGFQFSFGDTVITTKAIDGSFPDWRRVMPAAHHGARLVGYASDIAAFADSFMRSRKDDVAIALTCDDTGEVTYRVRQNESDAAGIAPMQCEHLHEGTKQYDNMREKTAGVNARYLRDTAAACDGSMTLYIDTGMPWLVTSDDATTVHAIMPLRVREGK